MFATSGAINAGSKGHNMTNETKDISALQTGDRIVFEDMIHYTFVKNTTFNGVNLPSLAVWTASGELRVVRRFGYADFKGRLS